MVTASASCAPQRYLERPACVRYAETSARRVGAIGIPADERDDFEPSITQSRHVHAAPEAGADDDRTGHAQ